MDEHADTSFNTTGSKWLQPVSEYLGFPLDQVGASGPEIAEIVVSHRIMVTATSPRGCLKPRYGDSLNSSCVTC